MTKKKWIIFIIIIILITGYFMLDSQSTSENRISKDPPKEKKKGDQSNAEAQLEGAAMTLYSRDETTKWELKAESIEHFSNRKQVELTGMSAEVYEDGEQVIVVSAQGGILDVKTNFLELEGPLTIKSKDKKIKADRLTWNSSKNELIGSGDILLKQQGLEVKGEKFVSQIDLKRLRVLDEVHVISHKEDDKNEK